MQLMLLLWIILFLLDILWNIYIFGLDIFLGVSLVGMGISLVLPAVVPPCRYGAAAVLVSEFSESDPVRILNHMFECLNC